MASQIQKQKQTVRKPPADLDQRSPSGKPTAN